MWRLSFYARCHEIQKYFVIGPELLQNYKVNVKNIFCYIGISNGLGTNLTLLPSFSVGCLLILHNTADGSSHAVIALETFREQCMDTC